MDIAPAAKQQLVPQSETASQVLAAQAKALVEARYTIALHQPRDLDTVREKLLKECHRPSFAHVARYRKPIGKGVEGPSIRFAEAALQALGNVVIDTPTIFDDAERRIVRVSVSDMESNISYSQDIAITKTIERRSVQPGDTVIRQRQNKEGQTLYLRLATDDEILNTQQALISKALRTLGLRLVPGWLIEEAMEAVQATQRKGDAADPDAARRKLFDAFGLVGVTVEQLKEWLGHDGNPSPAELAELRGVYTAIKEGDTSWRETMEERKPKPEAQEDKKAAGLKEQINKAKDILAAAEGKKP